MHAIGADTMNRWLGDIAHAQQCNFLEKRTECAEADGPYCRHPNDGTVVPDIAPLLFGAKDKCAGNSDPAWGSGACSSHHVGPLVAGAALTFPFFSRCAAVVLW